MKEGLANKKKLKKSGLSGTLRGDLRHGASRHVIPVGNACPVAARQTGRVFAVRAVVEVSSPAKRGPSGERTNGAQRQRKGVFGNRRSESGNYTSTRQASSCVTQESVTLS